MFLCLHERNVNESYLCECGAEPLYDGVFRRELVDPVVHLFDEFIESVDPVVQVRVVFLEAAVHHENLSLELFPVFLVLPS
jgi:hypothetical protein